MSMLPARVTRRFPTLFDPGHEDRILQQRGFDCNKGAGRPNFVPPLQGSFFFVVISTQGVGHVAASAPGSPVPRFQRFRFCMTRVRRGARGISPRAPCRERSHNPFLFRGYCGNAVSVRAMMTRPNG